MHGPVHVLASMAGAVRVKVSDLMSFLNGLEPDAEVWLGMAGIGSGRCVQCIGTMFDAGDSVMLAARLDRPMHAGGHSLDGDEPWPSQSRSLTSRRSSTS